MSLSRALAALPLEQLVQELSVADARLRLRLSPEHEEDEQALEWLREFVAVQSGGRSSDDTWALAIEERDYAWLASQLPHLVGDERKLAESAELAWREALAVIDEQRQECQRLVVGITESDLLARAEEELLEEQRSRLDSLAGLQGEALSPLAVQSLDEASETLSEVADIVRLLEAEVTSQRERHHQDTVLAARLLADRGFELVLSEVETERSWGLGLLGLLPQLVHARATDELLEAASALVDDPHTQSLMTMRHDTRKRTSGSRRPRPLVAAGKLELSPVSKVTLLSQAMFECDDDTPALEVVRSVRGAAERQPALDRQGQILLSGALRLLQDHTDKDASELLGEGLEALARAKLADGRFNQSVAMFRDALAVEAAHLQQGEPPSKAMVGRICGVLFSHWLTRVQSGTEREILLSRADGLIRDLPGLLLELRAKDGLEALKATFSELDGRSTACLATVLSTDPAASDWGAALTRYALMPGPLLREPELHVARLREVLLVNGAPDDMSSPLDELLQAVQAAGRSRSARTSAGVRQAFDRLQASLQGALDEQLLAALAEASDEAAAALEDGRAVGRELKVNVSPVSGHLYPDECGRTVHLDVAVRVHDDSRPPSRLTVTASIEEGGESIEVKDGVRDVGRLQPGEYEEVRLKLKVAPGATDRLNAFTVRLGLQDGDRPFTPTDRKVKHTVKLMARRPGSAQSPFVTGTALTEDSEVFVGRDADMQRVITCLIGQTQDNVPLVLGIRRIGKTSLLKRLVVHSEITPRYVALVKDLQPLGDAETTGEFFAQLATDIRDAVKRDLGVQLELCREDLRRSPQHEFPRFAAQIDRLELKKRVLIVFDEFENLLAKLDAWQARADKEGRPFGPHEALVDVLEILRSSLHHVERLSYIISGVPDIKTAFKGEGNRFYGNMEVVELRPLDTRAATELMGHSHPAFDIGPKVRDDMMFLTGRQPYLLQAMLNRLFNLVVIGGQGEPSRNDLKRVVRAMSREPSLFKELLALDQDESVLRALANTHNQAASRSHYVSIDSLEATLKRLGLDVAREDLEDRLERLAKPEVGLVSRAPNARHRWRLEIGLLSDFLGAST